MIKSNLMPSASGKVEPQVLKMKVKSGGLNKKTANESKSRLSSVANFLFMLFIFFISGLLYLLIFGVPGFLRGTIPQNILDLLGLSEETAATEVLRKAGAPKLTAHGTRAEDPAVPINGSVEEVVRTMRPDIYFKDRQLTSYKEQALSNRIPYQKQAFHIMLSTFYKATPDGIGYLDLAYQAPNFYFVRVVAQDSRTRTSYLDQLRAKVMPDMIVRDSAAIRDGGIEFSVFGSTAQPNLSELKPMRLVQYSRVKSEIMALRTLAVANQVRLVGWENPLEEGLETYRRIILRTTTDADYPSLLNFAEALQKSDVAFGVQQFVSRPAGPEKMLSALEFVLYAAMK